MRPLTIIVAMTPKGVIGKGGKIPWHYSEDLKRFKALTTGHAIIMGRRTFESIGKPLPNRQNIVVSRQASGSLELPQSVITGTGFAVKNTFEAALATAYDNDASPFVIGGAEIYKLALPLATRAEVTLIHEQDVSGDDVVYFPEGDAVSPEGAPLSPRTWGQWRLAKCQAGEAWEVEYLTFERRER
jgi:dihydrofolate reductase